MEEEAWQDYKGKKYSKPLPLKGIRVLEVCTLILGPSGPGFLAMMGAEVIKCEIPPMGDTCRDMTPLWLSIQRKRAGIYPHQPQQILDWTGPASNRGSGGVS
jgi:crotonobetainyl-CoA:carnitine CoA-transferase CaiB-like acyl-CoA transferase